MQKPPMIKDWLEDFLAAHWTEFDGRAWPGPEDRIRRQAWSDWMRSLIDLKASRVETELAASQLQGQELESPAAWLEAVVIEIGLIRKAAAMPPPPSERDVAQDASRDCPHCGGEGLVIVPGVKSTMAAHCVCPMGRWTRSRFKPEDLRRIPDYAEYLRDRSEQAAAALREFYELGWEFRWYPDEGQFRTHRARDDAPEKVSRKLSNRCRELRPEIYDLLGHPIESEEVMDMSEFRDENGKFHWRAMVEAIAERSAIHAPV